MIRRIIDFKDRNARHAMIPLVKIDGIDEVCLVREALEEFERHRHSRMPVFSERFDNMIGILDIADLVSCVQLDQSIKTFMQRPLYVAEFQSLHSVMDLMQQSGIEMVVVVDEYGGAVGLLTLEDILEEIVGEIQDEYDRERVPIKSLTDSQWVVESRITIDELNDQIKAELPTGNYETLSGFLLQQFGNIPEVGDELFFDTTVGSFRFQIRNSDHRRIHSVLIERISSSD